MLVACAAIACAGWIHALERYPHGCDDSLRAFCSSYQNTVDCHRDLERDVLLHNERATRRGDALALRLAHGREKLLTDVTEAGKIETYHLLAYLPQIRAYLVSVDFYEGGESLLVSVADGRETRIEGCPVLSPDGRWLATSSGNFETDEPFAVEIWNVGTPQWTRVFRLDATDWIPGALSFKDDHTLLLEATGLRPRTDEKVTLSLVNGAWRAPQDWR